MTPLFGPGWGNYAIRGIIETSIPEAVSLYPRTPGWWLLLAGFVTFLAWRLWRRRQRWLQNQYRRDALASLAQIQARLENQDFSALRELAPLLRATALAAGERRTLAALGGDAWQQAVNAMAPDLPELPVVELERLAYAPMADICDTQPDATIDALAAWINGHGSSHA